MPNAIARNESIGRLRLLQGGCILHAAIVLSLWVATFPADLEVIPGKLWLALAWLWIVWPIAIALHPAFDFKQRVLPVVAGAALLAPCIPVIYTFTVWAIWGFAP